MKRALILILVIGILLLSNCVAPSASPTPAPAPAPTPAPPTPALAPAATVDGQAPDFTLPNLDGESVSLSDFNGKPVLIHFGSTGGAYILTEMLYLQQLYDEMQGEELMVLVVIVRENSAAVKQYMQDHNLSLPVLLDTTAAVAQRYNIRGIPTTFFIDKDGIIQEKIIGAFPNKEAIENRLSKILP